MPVEHRWYGIDRRPLPLALGVLAVVLVMIVVIPAIDRAVSWDDEVAAGDVITMGQGLTFVPPVGWSVEDGIRVGEEPATGVGGQDVTALLTNGGVTVAVTASSYDGTAEDLLALVSRAREQADDEGTFEIAGATGTVTTTSGLTGISEPFTSTDGDGRLVVFVIDAGEAAATPTGLTFTITAAPGQSPQATDAVDALLASVTYEEPS